MISVHQLGLDTIKESVYAVLERRFLSPSSPHLFSQAGEDAPRTETARFRDEEDHARLTEVVPPPENFPLFAYTALPFSMLLHRIDRNILLSDVVGLVNKVTYVLPPSGNARSPKRQVYITDGRSKHLPWCIELHSANQSHSEPTVSSIEEIAAFEPNDIMGECYKISSRITDVLITKGWYYISCKEYWKMVTLEDGVYKCPWCPTVIPLPRYRLIVGAVDAGSTDPLAAKFTDLYLFGPPEETVVQKEDLYLFGPPEETVVRKEALLLVSSVQIVEPIVRANVVLREGVDCSAVGQDNVGIPAPETPKHVPGPAETSTPPLSMDLTPQTAGNIFSFRY
ncbi:hypothetical protein ACQ4PT_029179 [Festuca glaucescens]